MKIRASAEDYLETVLLLTKRTGVVRAVDIAAEMGFSKPSVSVAMRKLREDGLVETDADGFITLTDAGSQTACRVYGRHRVITEWLTKIGVSPETAAEDACRMEHVISEETFMALRNGLRKI